MKKVFTTLAVVLFSSLCLSACSYQGGYRYQCQDPANWQAKECLPPECKALGLCTEDILGFDPANPQGAADNSTPTTGGTNG